MDPKLPIWKRHRKHAASAEKHRTVEQNEAKKKSHFKTNERKKVLSLKPCDTSIRVCNARAPQLESQKRIFYREIHSSYFSAPLADFFSPPQFFQLPNDPLKHRLYCKSQLQKQPPKLVISSKASSGVYVKRPDNCCLKRCCISCKHCRVM